jgi:antitoxin component YwqK of YwqJK toxin-antitoxin module
MMNKILFPLKHLLLSIVMLSTIAAFATEGDINRTDAKGQRQGYWIVKGSMINDKLYKPEDKVEEGVYQDNRKQGLWKRYWPSGKLRNEINYASGKPEGEYKLYYDNGKLEEHGNWSNNKNIGDFKRYHTNGNPQQQFYFDGKGKRNGMQKYYHDNGKLALEVNVVNGAESGICKRYDHNGQVVEEKTFENGVVKQGSIRRTKPLTSPTITNDPYDKSIGKESKVTEDKTNKALSFKPNGFNVLYDKNGNVTQSGEFQQGRLYDGKWYRYNSDGLLIRIEIYKGGRYIGTGVISEQD